MVQDDGSADKLRPASQDDGSGWRLFWMAMVLDGDGSAGKLWPASQDDSLMGFCHPGLDLESVCTLVF